MAKQEITVEQLLSADPMSLSVDDIMRRSAIINMQKAERELEIAQEQNSRFRDEKEARLKRVEVNMQQIKATQEEESRIRELCKHKTGGKDRQGFFNGDGDIYGYCVSRQMLPTGEIYGLCFRCQKEWHHPRWTRSGLAVAEGRMTLLEYVKQEKEFNEMLAWPAKTFSTDTGELPGGQMFLIPMLSRQQAEDGQKFQQWLKKQPPEAMQMALLGLGLGQTVQLAPQ
jgi:hypothetical protein